jgi:chemotaxis protein CheD
MGGMSALALRDAGPSPEGVRGTAYLHPGDLLASGEPMALTTILGSCVGVCLFDAESRTGGMNHFLLPDSLGARPTTRFGDLAMPRLLTDVLEAGGRRGRLQARVFGGACVLDAFRATAASHLGERNAEVALRFLEQHGIPVVSRDIGGKRGRKLVFHTDDGTVSLREI